MLRDLERERRVPALVIAELLPVEPGGCLPVRCAEYEEDAFPGPLRRHLDGPRVPADIGAVWHAAQLGSPRERHENFALAGQSGRWPSGLLALIGLVKCETPLAV